MLRRHCSVTHTNPYNLPYSHLSARQVQERKACFPALTELRIYKKGVDFE